MEKSNSIFQSLRKRKFISEEELKYFFYKYKDTNFGKMYLLPKIHKHLVNVLGDPVIPNCAMSTEKASKFLDYHLLQSIMRSGMSCIKKDTNDFLLKLKNLNKVPDNASYISHC